MYKVVQLGNEVLGVAMNKFSEEIIREVNDNTELKIEFLEDNVYPTKFLSNKEFLKTVIRELINRIKKSEETKVDDEIAELGF